MVGQRVGYVRVSALDRHTDRQLDGIDLDRLFTDKASGKNVARAFDGSTGPQPRRPAAHRLPAYRQGVRFEFVKEQLAFIGDDSPMANLLLSVIDAFAEFERALIRERPAEGIAKAKHRGA